MSQPSDAQGAPTDGASGGGAIVQGSDAEPWISGARARTSPTKNAGPILGAVGRLSSLPFLIALLAAMLGLPIQLERINIDRGLAGAWAIPAQGDLETVTGVLEPPYRIVIHNRRSADIDWSIGNLVTNDGQVFSYSCQPGGDHLQCLDPNGQAQGHRVTISYFYMPRWIYPTYQFVDRDTQAESPVARKAAAIAMEATDDDGGQSLLTYDDSVRRLTAYQGAHAPFFAPMIDAARGQIGLPPIPTPLVAAGRGQDGAEEMAQAAAATAQAMHGLIGVIGEAMAVLGFLMPITWVLGVLPGLREGRLHVPLSRYSRETTVVDRATEPQEFWTRIALSGGMSVVVCAILVSAAALIWRH